jgi:exosortase B
MSAVLEQRLSRGRGSEGVLRWLPVALGLAAMYAPTYVELAHGLWQQEAYAHGPIILVVVAWLVWRQRAALASEAAGRSAPLAGWAMLAFGLLLYAVGRSQGMALFEVGSHLPVLAGTVVLLLGWRALAQLWFPLFFLVFLVPLPGFVIDIATAPLKNFVSHIVESLLYELGYPIARAGVILMIGQYQMLVTDACSGLNSLYSLAALGFLYLYLTGPGTLVRNAALLASIVPIALVANAARVLLLTLITFYFGEEAGQGFLHGFAGVTLFVTALLLLLGLDVLLQRRPGWRGPGAPK